MLCLKAQIFLLHWPFSHRSHTSSLPRAAALCLNGHLLPWGVSKQHQTNIREHILITPMYTVSISRLHNNGHLSHSIVWPISVYDWTQSNLVGQIYCTLSMGESLTTLLFIINGWTTLNTYSDHFLLKIAKLWKAFIKTQFFSQKLNLWELNLAQANSCWH